MISRLRRVAILLAAVAIVAMFGLVLPAAAETQAASDGAEATGPDRVVVGQAITISGTGWKTASGVGSVIAIQLDEGSVVPKKTPTNPADGTSIEQKSVYDAVRAKDDGSFEVSLPFPTADNASAAWEPGKHSVQLLTGNLLTGDVERAVTLPIDVAEQTSTPSPTPSIAKSPEARPAASPSQTPSASARLAAAAQCPKLTGKTDLTSPPAFSFELTADNTVQGRPAAPLGGDLRLTGSGFCHPDGTGSVIALKINEGAFERVKPVHTNVQVWQVIEAEDDGTFDVSVKVPEANDTKPAFTAGAYTLRLLTGSTKAGDFVRTGKTTEFVVTGPSSAPSSDTLPKPTEIPEPIDPVKDLTAGKKGGVTATQSGSKLTLTMPELSAGDWVYPYVFTKEKVSGFSETAYEPYVTAWLQLDNNKSVTLDMADYDVDGATAWRLSLQDRDQKLVGWTPVSKFASAADDTSSDSDENFSSTSSDTAELADTGGSRPAFLLLGALLIVAGIVVLRIDMGRGDLGRNNS